jgi:hypothetical protein
MTRRGVRRSTSPAVSTARKGCKKSPRRSGVPSVDAKATATLFDGGADDNAQVVQDVRQVAIAVLANRRRRAISGGAEVKVTVSTLFLTTASCARGLIKQVAWLDQAGRGGEGDCQYTVSHHCELRAWLDQAGRDAVESPRRSEVVHSSNQS